METKIEMFESEKKIKMGLFSMNETEIVKIRLKFIVKYYMHCHMHRSQ
jgi:hypothetical protein